MLAKKGINYDSENEELKSIVRVLMLSIHKKSTESKAKQQLVRFYQIHKVVDGVMNQLELYKYKLNGLTRLIQRQWLTIKIENRRCKSPKPGSYRFSGKLKTPVKNSPSSPPMENRFGPNNNSKFKVVLESIASEDESDDESISS